MNKYESLKDIEKQQIIEQLYIVKKQSFQQIAEQYNTYANKIRRDAKKFKIDIRNKSEAQKNALQTGSHKHPTKGTQRSQDTKNKIGKSVLNSWGSLEESELDKRRKDAKNRWNNLTQDQRDNIVKSANIAVRESSKTGSKLEKYLLSELLAAGYKVDFHKEQILSNTKLQIDLFLPQINIAIEVDGPSHFLPVWGEDALKRNIKYDNKKTGLILGKGLVLIRIKQIGDFSPTRGRMVFDQLLQEIKKIENKFPASNNRVIEIGE